MDKALTSELKETREALAGAKFLPEEDGVARLVESHPFTKSEREKISKTAGAMVEKSRAMKRERGTIDVFLQEFGLSTQEGVALMCLAEALLRIPDADTQDLLIAEKIKKGKWAEHLGKSEDALVNAGVFGLMLTGSVVKLDKKLVENPVEWVGRLVSRAGEPVIRAAVLQAMRILGRQFVFGRTMAEALKRKAKRPEGERLYSFDMLGEGARTKAAAERYHRLYLESIRAVGEMTNSAGGGHLARSNVSIKLTALHPRYEYVKKERVMAEMLPMLKEQCRLAKSCGIGLTIDAEEADRLDLSLDLIEALAFDPELKGWDGLGLAVQAYQKRAPYVVDWAAALARASERRIPVRLVKGAYWDSEVKHAQVMGYPDYPVWTRKANTDLSYLYTAHKMFAAGREIYPMFATHNAHTIAAIAEMAGERDFEFQRIHGMGEVMYRAAFEVLGKKRPLRIYAPVGAHEDLLPYLVRRLLENGANSSFVNRFMDSRVQIAEIVADPLEKVKSCKNVRHAQILLPAKLYGDRPNSAGFDVSSPAGHATMAAALKRLRNEQYQGFPIVGGKPVKAKPRKVASPQDPSHQVGVTAETPEKEMLRALETAHKAQAAWDRLGGEKRAEILEKAGNLVEARRETFISLAAREGGKTIADGIAEVREAADYCRYYALQARKHFAAPLELEGPTGEDNMLSLHGRGVFLCIAPWNFPLAIFLGQVTAALGAGNAVLAKPAGQTPLIAAEAIRLLHDAGVPEDVLHFVPASGSAVGKVLVAHPKVAGVALTGSTATARIINKTLAERDGPIVPLIAETGGQNAMIVDSSALPEQVTDDVMISAFSSAGQRCSALRVLFVQEEIADKLIEMLQGALAERKVGDPEDLATDVGPMIDQGAMKDMEAHARRMEKQGKLLGKAPLAKGLKGAFFPPHMFEIPSLSLLEDEVFGPILHVIRYRAKDLNKVLDQIAATGFGLTFGIHSRIEQRWDELFASARIGNTYINRNMIGAVVGVQPFGGQGLSGTGPKAGGPHYLPRFATEKTLSVNTTAIGGNAALFSMEEGEGEKAE